MAFRMVLLDCLLLLAGLIVGFNITLFVRQNRCHMIYTKTFRPGTLTKEVQKKLIFVGVMTADKFLETRAEAVFNTWGKNVDGKLMFFTSDTTQRKFDLPVVSLPGVDDSYPPLKKSFMMLKYMHDHHIDEYEWFMRADDDVYVRNDKLVGLLRSLNSSDDIHLGQAGTGSKEERGKLHLLPGDNYCMGGPGVILSRSVFKKVAPHLEHCLQTVLTSWNDIELGRCIQRYVGISCTWSYEMQTLFFHRYTEKGTGAIFYGDLNTKTIDDAITLHALKDPAYMYRLHSHFMNKRIQDLQHKAVKLNRVLRTMDQLVQKNGNRPSLQKKKKKTSFQDKRNFHHQLASDNTEKWDMFTSKAAALYSDASLQSPARHAALKIEVNHLMQKITEFINDERAQKSRYGSRPRINYGYTRVHPLYGVEHIMQVTVDSKKETRNIRNSKTHERRFYFQQPFDNLQYSTEPHNDMPPYVHFIVPLVGRLKTFRRFMKNFELVCIKTLQRVKLVVAYSSSVSPPREHKAIMKEYRDKYPEADLIWFEIAGDFSRGLALSLAADKFDQTALLFLCDVDLIFNSEFIDRCRMNTALGKRVYFPILFSQFDPELTNINKTKPDSYFTINKDAGILTSHGYGIACIYHHDLDAVGGFNTTIKGWGWEDLDLFEKFVNHEEIEVFRAADLGVIHVYHRKTCDPNLSVHQQTMCQGSKAAGLASQKSLVKAMLSIKGTGHD